MNISVVGLGKLGSVLAGVMANSGHEVVGVDINPGYVASINAGRAPVREPGLDEMVSRNAARLSATTDLQDAVARTEVTFVVVPTPSGEDATFSLQYILNAAEPIGLALAGKSAYHLVVISSTVMPGSTGGEMRTGFRAMLQPRVHRARQCDSRHVETRHDPDRRIRPARGGTA
jgi:UDPglucose 6-dehydrogenase